VFIEIALRGLGCYRQGFLACLGFYDLRDKEVSAVYKLFRKSGGMYVLYEVWEQQ